jgi:hypothetical protein
LSSADVEATKSRFSGTAKTGYASPLRKTHSLKFESKRLLYPWHRWHGRDVLTRKATGRYSEHVLWCRLPDDDPEAMLIAIPRWMFDSAVCATMRAESRPIVCCAALRAVRALIGEMNAGVPSEVLHHQHRQPRPGDADVNDTPHATSSNSASTLSRVSGTSVAVAQPPAVTARRGHQEPRATSAQRSRSTSRRRSSKRRKSR